MFKFKTLFDEKDAGPFQLDQTLAKVNITITYQIFQTFEILFVSKSSKSAATLETIFPTNELSRISIISYVNKKIICKT